MNGNKMTPRTIVAGSMSQSSRIRELKRASSSGKAISDDSAASLRRPDSASVRRTGDAAGHVEKEATTGGRGDGAADDRIAKMGLDELRDQLKKTKREVSNRDTTLKALQRNYETLATVHEEGKKEHQRRKTALDQLSDKYSETQSKLDKSERTILSLNENIAKLEEAQKALEADRKKASSEASATLKAKQEAFDQLNTLYAEQTQRLTQGDGQAMNLKQRISELESAVSDATAKAKASERKVQQQDAQHEGKMKSMQAHAAALEREMLELREASKNQVATVRKQMQERGAEVDSLRASAATLRDTVSHLENELSACKNRECAASASAKARDEERNALKADIAELQAQLRKMAMQAENLKKAHEESKAEAGDAKAEQSKLMDQMSAMTNDLARSRAAYQELVGGMNTQMTKAQEEAIRKEEEREKERKRIECEKRALEEGLSEELRRVRQEAEKEMELIQREKLAAVQELAQVKDAVQEEGIRAKKDWDGAKKELEDEVAQARALAEKFAAERQDTMSRMEEALRSHESERARETKVAKARVEMLQDSLGKEKAARIAAEEARKKLDSRLLSAESLLAAAEKAREEACTARDQTRAELRAAEEKSEKSIKAAELKMGDMFKKIRELEANKRTVEGQLAEITDRNGHLQSSLDEIQSKMVLLHETSSSSQKKVRDELEALLEEKKVLTDDAVQLRASLQEASDRRKEDAERGKREQDQLLASIDQSRRELAAKELECAHKEGALKEELLRVKETARSRLSDEERKVEDGRREVERIKANLMESDTKLALESKKYRALEEDLKAKEAELQSARGQVYRLENELQKKVDALSSLDSLGEKSKEVLTVIKNLQAASDAMESAVTCLNCLAPLKSCVTCVPCGHNICGTCWEKACKIGRACPECGDTSQGHADNEALDQLASKFSFQKQALASLLTNAVIAPFVNPKS